MSRSAGPRRLGKYELYECLGRGGMAQVWKAWDPQLQRYVAVKILHLDLQDDPDFSTRFLREARVVASLHHPNIVQIYDFDLTSSSESKQTIAYMVMEYIEGGTLADYITNTLSQGQVPPMVDIVHLFTVISKAVDYAHKHGVIHRDIKPANILLDHRNSTHTSMGEPILTDFGLVKLLSAPRTIPSGIWLGTPLYTSPEQAQSHTSNERSDIYSLGVILYELCTGVRPFNGRNPIDVIMQHIHTMPPTPAFINPTVPPAVAEVILRCLAKDPIARFPSASSLADALAQAVNMSTHEDLHPPAYTTRIMDESIHKSSSSFDLSPGVKLPSPASPSVPVAPTTHQFATWANLPAVPLNNRAGTFLTPVAQALAVLAALPTLAPRRKGRGWPTALLAIVIIAVIGSSLAIFFRSTHRSTVITMENQIVGHAFFVSSGQLNKNSIPSINDQFQMNLQHIPAPAPSESYYAWLLRDENQPLSTPTLLGKLSLTQGTVHFLYPGDPEHTNLLAVTSRVLITEEDATLPPMNPSPDASTWKYYAALPQQPDLQDTMHHFSMLDHLRVLLAQDPTISGMDIHSELAIWLLINTGKVVEWANSARDFWQDKDTTAMRLHFIRILDYLDGEANVQADVPAGTPLGVPAPVALLGPDTPDVQLPADYLHQMSGHLNALARAPGATLQKRQLAARINTAITIVRNWLEQVRQDAKGLLSMTDAQLVSQDTLAILDDMVAQAFYAYVGRLDPSTNEVQAGAVQINYDTERLATFDITPYQQQ